MKRQILTGLIAHALLCTVLVDLYAAEATPNPNNDLPACKACALRARPNTQPNQYEYYEDYLKAQENQKNPSEQQSVQKQNK